MVDTGFVVLCHKDVVVLQVDKVEFFTEKGSISKYHVPVVNLEGVSDSEYPPQKKAFRMLQVFCL